MAAAIQKGAPSKKIAHKHSERRSANKRMTFTDRISLENDSSIKELSPDVAAEPLQGEDSELLRSFLTHDQTHSTFTFKGESPNQKAGSLET